MSTDERLDADFARMEAAERVAETAWMGAELAKRQWMSNSADMMRAIMADYRDTVIGAVADHIMAVEIFADMEHPFDFPMLSEFTKRGGNP
jgi:hypothetical protein